MTYKLWLDDQIEDERTPDRWIPEGYVGFDNVYQAIKYIDQHGLPEFMDLDHDLGHGKPTGMDFLKMLQARHSDQPPPEWSIHSKNVCGKRNMEAFLRSWKQSLAD